jgi:hypothetical protein
VGVVVLVLQTSNRIVNQNNILKLAVLLATVKLRWP